MNKKGITIKALAGLIFALSLYSAAQAQPRVFVSSVGSDANPCSRTAPCRTFQKGHDTVAAGGEVVALDAAGYGTVSITKSVTITGEGVYAGITVTSGNGITVSIGASDTVVLRGLTLNGAGGTHGISLTGGGNLYVENCVVTGFSSGTGVLVNGSAGASARLFVKDTICRRNFSGIVVNAGSASLDHVHLEQNSDFGLAVVGSGTHVSIANSVASENPFPGLYAASAELNIEACLVANNGIGIESETGATVRVSNSTVTNNFYGLFNNGATLKSRVNNTVDGNYTMNTSGAITTLSPT